MNRELFEPERRLGASFRDSDYLSEEVLLRGEAVPGEFGGEKANGLN